MIFLKVFRKLRILIWFLYDEKVSLNNVRNGLRVCLSTIYDSLNTPKRKYPFSNLSMYFCLSQANSFFIVLLYLYESLISLFKYFGFEFGLFSQVRRKVYIFLFLSFGVMLFVSFPLVLFSPIYAITISRLNWLLYKILLSICVSSFFL